MNLPHLSTRQNFISNEKNPETIPNVSGLFIMLSIKERIYKLFVTMHNKTPCLSL